MVSFVAALLLAAPVSWSQQASNGSDIESLKQKLEQVLKNQEKLASENQALRDQVNTLQAEQGSARTDAANELETSVNNVIARMEGPAVKSAATALTLTGEFRYRTVAAWINPGDLDGWWTDARVRLGMRYDFTKDVSAYAEFQSHWALGDGSFTEGAGMNYNDGGVMSADGLTNVDLYQGWAELRNIFNRSELSWRIGRQEVVLGNQFQFGNADWYNGWALDGSRFDWNGKDFSLTGLVMKTSSTDFDANQLHSIVNSHDNDELLALYGSIKPCENHTIDLYWIYTNGHGGAAGGSGSSIGSLGNGVGSAGFGLGDTAYFHTLGARAGGKFPSIANGLDYNVEVAYQVGDVSGSPVGVTDVDGLAVEGEVGITFDSKYQFRVYTRWLYAEGPNDNDTGYIFLYPNRHGQGAFLARYGLLDALPIANAISGQLGLTFVPSEQWVVGAQAVWDTADVNDLNGVVNDHDYGWEVDLWALYQVTPQFSLVGGLILLFPDDEGAALWGTNTDTAVAAALQARISF